MKYYNADTDIRGNVKKNLTENWFLCDFFFLHIFYSLPPKF